MGRILTVLILFIGISNSVFSQDVQFSQYYAAPTFMNPGYAGGAHDHRVIFQQRLQWPKLDAQYITSLISYDFFMPEYQSGWGVYVLQDFQGSSDVTSTEVHFQYAYELPVTRDLIVRPGLQAGLASRNTDYRGLTFPQQYNDIDGLYRDHSYGFGAERKVYPDFGAGVVAYTNDFWFSASAHHLNLPNQSKTTVARLPLKYTFALGYKISFSDTRNKMAYLHTEDDVHLTPVVHYKFQGKNDQLDMGVYGSYQQLLLGLWYRGIPTKKYDSDLHNNESVIFMAGWQFGSFSFSYSYDYTLSTLTKVGTGGSHELNITWIHSSQKRRKPRKRLPCPTFYGH